MARAVVGIVVRRVPVPWAVVSEADVHAPWAIVSRHEPPHVRVVVPAWLHEDIVHTLHHAVPIDPHILAVGVAPVRFDPNSFRADDRPFVDGDDTRRRGCGFGGSRWLRFLNDDDRLAVELLWGAGFRLDDHVGCRLVRRALLPFADVAVVRHLQAAIGSVAVAVGTVVVGGRRNRDRRRTAERQYRREPNEGIHNFSLICTSAWPRRHPPKTERARPARHSAHKVLGFRRF